MAPDVDVLRRMYVSEKMSLADIGRLHGVHKTQVRRWLVRAGIETRGISEATSLATKGKPRTPAQLEAIKVKLPKMWAATARPESRAKHAATMRAKYENEPHPAKGTKWSEATHAAHAYRKTPEYREAASVRQRGEKSPHWLGGPSRSDDRLRNWQWRLRRRECYERDNWTCQTCGIKCRSTRTEGAEKGRRIQAHHIVARRDGGSDDLANLVTLCASCHAALRRK